MFTYRRAPAAQEPIANNGLGPIVRPNLLSALETLGNWTDGRISCRHSTPTSFLVSSRSQVGKPDQNCVLLKRKYYNKDMSRVVVCLTVKNKQIFLRSH